MNTHERTAWLESRRNGIGSSDVPAILGASKWKTALDVYLAKVKPVEPDAPMPKAAEWGHRLEPVIAGAIIDHFGWTLEKVPTLRHPQYEWLIASPDRTNQDGELIEIKSTNWPDEWGEPETAEIPEPYFLQVQHQMEVADRPVCWVFVLIGQCDFRRYRVPRDTEYLPSVLPALSEFWNCVTTRTPPAISWDHKVTVSALNRLYQPKPGTFKTLGHAAEHMADEYQRLGDEIKAMTEQRDELKARLIAEMGEFEEGLLIDGRRIRRKLCERKAYEVKASQYVDFRILKGLTK